MEIHVVVGHSKLDFFSGAVIDWEMRNGVIAVSLKMECRKALTICLGMNMISRLDFNGTNIRVIECQRCLR
jgi:hypothetical protein